MPSGSFDVSRTQLKTCGVFGCRWANDDDDDDGDDNDDEYADDTDDAEDDDGHGSIHLGDDSDSD